jgi:hypothetical protein
MLWEECSEDEDARPAAPAPVQAKPAGGEGAEGKKNTADKPKKQAKTEAKGGSQKSMMSFFSKK